MANFYNPYSSQPQYGQGISEAIQQFIQMIMMKKMMGGQQQQGQQQIPPGQGALMGRTGMGATGQMGMGQSGMGQAGQAGGQGQIDPQMIIQLLQMLGMGGGR
jgi:hypothetical protein